MIRSETCVWPSEPVPARCPQDRPRIW